MKGKHLVMSWLWSIGLAGLLLPFLWWPRPFAWQMIAHGVVFIIALGRVIDGSEDGGIFDHKRAPVRGIAGVIAYSMVIFGSVLSYRTFVL